jgi:hypothetical protein
LGPAGKRELALGILRDELGSAMQRLRGADMAESDMLVLMAGARLGPEDRAFFYGKLRALVNEFSSHDVEDGRAYTLGLSLFPALHHPESAKTLRITERKKKT